MGPRHQALHSVNLHSLLQGQFLVKSHCVFTYLQEGAETLPVVYGRVQPVYDHPVKEEASQVGDHVVRKPVDGLRGGCSMP